MSHQFYARPVIFLSVSMMIGISLGNLFPGYLVFFSMAFFISFILIFKKILLKQSSFFIPYILFFCLGYLSIQPWLLESFPANHISNFLGNKTLKITGTIYTHPEKFRGQTKFLLKVEALFKNEKFIPVKGFIRVSIKGDGSGFKKGVKINFPSRIKPITNYNNPGGFDYKKYMIFKSVHGYSYAKQNQVEFLKKDSKNPFQNAIVQARSHISLLIENAVQTDHKEILKALIIGEKFAIPHPMREVFYRTGVGHLLAISGLHLGIVATAAFLFFSIFLSFIKPLLWQAWTKKGAAVLAFIPVLIYSLIAGMFPSTQRALIMVSFFLMTFWVKKDQDTINTLSIAALVIIVIHPPSLFSISFQLSFSAVLAIIYGLSKIKINYDFIEKKIKTKIILKFSIFVYVSLLAFFGTLPIIMLYFNRVSMVGMIANCISVPLIGFLVVPVGLLGVFLCPFSVTAGTFCFKTAAIILEKNYFILEFLSNLPWASVQTVTPTYFEIALYYLILWILFNYRFLKTQLFPDSGLKPVSWMKKYTLKVIFAAIFLISVIDIYYWMTQRFWNDNLKVTIIDVGQGSSALLELPKGYRILLDGGGLPDNSTFDIGAKIIAPLLWRKKIKTIDMLVLTHPNSDHLNGLLYIAENFNVNTIWTNNEPSQTLGYQRLEKIIDQNKIQMPIYQDMPRETIINGVRISVLYPPSDFMEKKIREKWRNTNNNSMVIKVTFGETSFLFTGDIMMRAEKELVQIMSGKLKSTVLLSPHHGSKSSNSIIFINEVEPDITIISSGQSRGSYFPHPTVLKKYKSRDTQIYQTSFHGGLCLISNGKKLRVVPTIKNNN